MRNMSFSLTERQFRDGTKDVTRRLGWTFLTRGDHFMGVRKAMGLRKGEKIERLGECRAVSVRRERIDACTDEDAAREGYPELSGQQFALLFCKHMGCRMDSLVTRIEFERVLEPAVAGPHDAGGSGATPTTRKD